jgi:oxygen-dependent protoporphyrinogen oxidase
VKLTGLEDTWEPLKADAPVSVGTVTFWIPNPELLPYKGFGYLRPRKIYSPQSVLGVLFEHNATPLHDSNEQRGTRLTVMLGGHHWNSAEGKLNSTIDELCSSSDKTLLDLATAAIKEQLGIDLDEHQHESLVRWNKDCIPQHTVNHQSRLKLVETKLNDTFGPNKVLLAGTAKYGPGVPDCVEGAYKAAEDIIYPGLEEWVQKEVGARDYVKPDPGRIF